MSKSDPAPTIQPYKQPDSPVNPGERVEWNGISLLTQKGAWRTRFSFSERLAICEANLTDLENFMELFCPLRPHYIKTKPGEPGEWSTPKNKKHDFLRLTPELVLRHLTCDAIPTQAPIWVGAKCWEWTTWFAIDIDNQGDEEELEARRIFVEKSLMVMGVKREHIFMLPTPSDGWHYFVFLQKPKKLEWIPFILEKVGLSENRGSIEIFPRKNQGMRLPFGYLPEHDCNHRFWPQFIRHFESGKRHRFSWRWISKRAHAAEQKVLSCERKKRVYVPPAPQLTLTQTCSQATPVASTSESPASVVHPEESLGVQRYRELLQSVNSTKKADELLRMGILCAGTRLTATRKLAWHLIVARKLTADEATQQLTEWVYRTGAETSEDVKKDIRNGTRYVAEQTRDTVTWAASLPENAPTGWRHFTELELEGIARTLVVDDLTFTSNSAEVALRFLHYLKQNGTKNSQGWQGAVAVRSVMRRWKHCSGMRYRRHVKLLTDAGLITMTREKLQSKNGKGRARTYQLHVCVSEARPTMGLGDAISYLEELLSTLKKNKAKMETFQKESYTYRENWVPSKMDDEALDSPLEKIKSDTSAGDSSADLAPVAEVPDDPEQAKIMDDKIADLLASKMPPAKRDLNQRFPRPNRGDHFPSAY